MDWCVGIVNYVTQRLYHLQSEHLVQYFYADFDQPSGSTRGSPALRIAAEYLQSSALKTAEDFGRVSEQRTAQILKQVLEGLRYLHDEAQIEA